MPRGTRWLCIDQFPKDDLFRLQLQHVHVLNPTELVRRLVRRRIDILQIISALNEAYDISIPASEIVPANFNSAEALLAMVERLSEE